MADKPEKPGVANPDGQAAAQTGHGEPRKEASEAAQATVVHEAPQSTKAEEEEGAKKEDETPTLPLCILEAYILRPHTEAVQSSIMCSYKVELLLLDEAAIRAHLNQLGPKYSVINAISELPPNQLVPIQALTRSRNGRLVSIQQGAPAVM
ncbi:hypothetical protein BDW02DRAFT_596021 [Decorospora gaudefroyi]|uniref:Uncharacterized protein n=1 Tax=Decorospora gaudefroyi TaxID=184978 RepID=A0A6A5KM36_9PLEO|nr:hypothetical protein BDW02DRAFT_596021 [Decorospora gaudefroyi]